MLGHCLVHIVSCEAATKIVDKLALRVEEVNDDGVINLRENVMQRSNRLIGCCLS